MSGSKARFQSNPSQSQSSVGKNTGTRASSMGSGSYQHMSPIHCFNFIALRHGEEITRSQQSNEWTSKQCKIWPSASYFQWEDCNTAKSHPAQISRSYKSNRRSQKDEAFRETSNN